MYSIDDCHPWFNKSNRDTENKITHFDASEMLIKA
jgi:hypothetical protein